MIDQPASWRMFVSFGTVLSGILMVLVMQFGYGWVAALCLVALLYAHEAGHVLAARLRHVPVLTPPVFIPGLGAYVTVGHINRPWDQLLVSLGGPLAGAAAALVVKQSGYLWAGTAAGAMVYAGQLALWVNLLNLIPALPLDGGRALSAIGWVGVIPAVVLLWYGIYTHVPFFMWVGAIAAGLQVWAPVGGGGKVRVPWAQVPLLLAAYGAAVALLVWLIGYSGPVPLLGHAPHLAWLWLQRWGLLLLVAYWYALGKIRSAWAPGRDGITRYLILTALGWIDYLFRLPTAIPVPAMALAQLAGLPGNRWLAAYIRLLGPRGDRAAGFATAAGYDCLRKQERPGDAANWLQELFPVLQRGGPGPAQAFFGDMNLLGYRDVSAQTFLAECDGRYDPRSLPLLAANNLAWVLLVAGRTAEAVPYVEAMMEHGHLPAAYLDTVGRVLTEAGRLAEGERYLRESLAEQDDALTRVALARALAAQGRYSEAVTEGERALRTQRGPWPEDEPPRGQVETWIDRWRDAGSV